MQIVMAIDGDQKHELESMIRDLEDENKWVQLSYSFTPVMFALSIHLKSRLHTNDKPANLVQMN